MAHQTRQGGGRAGVRTDSGAPSSRRNGISRCRPRAHAHIVKCGRYLRLVGQPTPPTGTPAALRRRPGASGPVAAGPRSAATQATSCAPSTSDSRTHLCGAAPTRRMGAVSTANCSRARSPTDSPAFRPHRARGHRTLLITGALDFIIEPIRPTVRRHRVRRDGGSPGQADRPPHHPPAHWRGTRPAAGRLRNRARTLPRGVRRLRRFGQRPGDARSGRLPGGGESRVPAVGHRPAPRLARRTMGQGPGGSHRPLPLGPFDVTSPRAVLGR